MILPPKTARAIATGRLTVLRIPAKRGKAGAPFVGCPWQLGREYSIPEPLTDLDRVQIAYGDKPAPPPLGSVRVTSTGRPVTHERTIRTGERAGQTITVTHEQPVALFLDTDDDRIAWVREHDAKWLEKHAGDIRWAKAYDRWATRWARDQRHAESYILLERYRQRWEGRPVWVVCFELVSDVRYLAQPDPVKAQGDYTRTPSRAIDPLCVVDAATQARYSKTAEAFCIGRQLARQKEAKEARANGPRQAKRNSRVAMFRDAA